MGSSGHLTEEELVLVCQSIGLQGLAKEGERRWDVLPQRAGSCGWCQAWKPLHPQTHIQSSLSGLKSCADSQGLC